MGHTRKRALEEALEAGEVEMKDADSGRGKKRGSRRVGEEAKEGEEGWEEVGAEEMAIDEGPV